MTHGDPGFPYPIDAGAPSEGLLRLTHIVYALHAFSALMGVISSAMIITAFLTGWPSILAVVINLVKRSEAHDTWLESHFSWQIRTFCYAFLWLVIAGLLLLTVIGIPIGFMIMIATGIWVLYRIIRGWLALNDGRPIEV